MEWTFHTFFSFTFGLNLWAVETLLRYVVVGRTMLGSGWRNTVYTVKGILERSLHKSCYILPSHDQQFPHSTHHIPKVSLMKSYALFWDTWKLLRWPLIWMVIRRQVIRKQCLLALFLSWGTPQLMINDAPALVSLEEKMHTIFSTVSSPEGKGPAWLIASRSRS